MEILAKKEKELAEKEAEFQKERIFNEKQLLQDAEALELREKELSKEKENLQKSVTESEGSGEEATSNLAKDIVDKVKMELKEHSENIEMPNEDSVIFDKLNLEEPKVESEEEKTEEVESTDFIFPSGFEVKRNYSVHFEQFNHEFITLVYVNVLRCTSDKAVAFKDYLNAIFESDYKKIILDVSLSEFIDSTFLGVMVSFLKKLRKEDREMAIVVDLSKMTTTTFLLSGLDKVFNIVEDVETAFNQFYKN